MQALVRAQELDDFLERASYDGGDAGSRPAGQQREEQAGEGGVGEPDQATAAGVAGLGSSSKLHELRPRELQLPASGLSTPATAQPSRMLPPLAQNPNPRGAARASGASAAAAAAGGARAGNPSKPPSPFTAAIRELMGLPGAAPLAQAAQAPGAARLSQVCERRAWQAVLLCAP